MTPTADQYDTTVDKINAAETLADTGLDVLPLFLVGVGLVLLSLALWYTMRSLSPMTVAIPMIAGLLIAAAIAILVILSGGPVDSIQTDQVSRVSECWLEGCR